MKLLSTGDKSTLGNYKKLSILFFGADSEQVAFLNKKISESPHGEDEEVIADESQMLFLLSSLIKEK